MKARGKKPRLYWKALLPGRKPYWGVGRWPEIGKWTRKRQIQMCLCGWHVSPTLISLNRFLASNTWRPLRSFDIYRVEIRGSTSTVIECDRHGNKYRKTVAEQARLVELVRPVEVESKERSAA